jgi:deoxyribonuclease-2
MGCCTSSCFNYFNKSSIIKYVALKLPHGSKGIEYCEQTGGFIHCDINTWLSQLYLNSEWTNWQIYNDETGHIIDEPENIHHKKGHCKGIVAWNNKRISWLCHSLPNFPKFFDGKIISDIESGELIYGQSFQYIEIDYSEEMIINIIKQLHIMEANIFISNSGNSASGGRDNFINDCQILEQIKITNLKQNWWQGGCIPLKLSNTITHIAKPPYCHIDIYSDYLVKEYNHLWKVETWIRGHHILEEPLSEISLDSSPKIIDITSLQFEDIKWTEKQDHSKWATTSPESHYWIGDLNRMTSQYKRGGGGFICMDQNIASAFNKLIK